MVMVAGQVAVIAVQDFSFPVREGVPDGIAFAVFIASAFYLVGR